MTEDKNKQMFLSLVYSFQMQTMMQMGKLANPMTQKVEKELDAAQVTIDMLDMLKDKSKGNLSDDESKFLDQVIADLKLNYVEEVSKSEKTEEVSSGENKNETAGTDAKSDSAPEEKEASKSESKADSKNEPGKNGKQSEDK